MPVINLTQDLVDGGLAVPDGKTKVEWCDATVRSLRLEQRAGSDVKTFFVRYRDKDRVTRHVKLGRASVLSLQNARAQAKKLLAEIALGQRDPRAEARAQKAAITMDTFFNDHYLPFAKPRLRSHARQSQLYARIGAKFGDRRLGQIGRKEVIEWHASLLEEGLAPASADHHAKLLRRLLNLAVEWQLLDRNPLARFPLLNANNQKERLLDPGQMDRLVGVLRAAAKEGSVVASIAAFALSSGARLNEILSATWDQIDIPNRV